jgi:lysozyme family protein
MADKSKFQRALEVVLAYEGGYTNDPDDPGGKTAFGIAQAYNPTVNVANLTEADAIDYYYHKWQEWQLEDLTTNVAAELFEQAVHFGPSQAWTNAQLACCLMGVTVKIDGRLGPITRHALNGLAVHYEDALVADLNGYQFQAYCARVSRNPNAAKYIKGWLKRTLAKLSRLNTGPKAKAGSSEA